MNESERNEPNIISTHHAGLEELQAAPVVARLIRKAGEGAQTIIVVGTSGAANIFAKQLTFFLDEEKYEILTLPEADPPFLLVEAHSHESEAMRLDAMTAITSEKAAVIVCPVSALLQDMCAPEDFCKACIKLPDVFSRDELVRKLVERGYRHTPYTEQAGEFSTRGDIVDIYPLNHEYPFRISFFDTEIENVKYYDPETQKSLQNEFILPAVIAPAAEPDPVASLTFIDWLTDDDVFISIDPGRIEQVLELRETEAIHDFETLLENGDVASEDWGSYRGGDVWKTILTRRSPQVFSPYGDLPENGAYKTDQSIIYEAKHTTAFYGQLDLLSAEIKRYLRLGFEITMVAQTEERLELLREFAAEEGFLGKLVFATGELVSGFELTSEKAVWLWDGDIFKSGRKSRRTRIKGHEKISAFTDIEKGDYIVHERHGIGLYEGIKTIESPGGVRDYLAIGYQGKDVLYVPVDQMDRIQKYVGGGERKPRVNKLGSDDWTRTKARVRAEIEEYAGELIRMAAERKLAKGHAFSPDTVWQKDFEDLFPYEPTPDQVRCFDAVRRDMENPWPMDRLICGDVGYGKTEVALRAVFKCVQDGKQAAILVPTTILAAQHFRTFSARFSDFPVRVEMLSRFQSAKAKNEIFAALKNGEVDIVIGTHSLLSPKVAFKDLGLLVIDEEQHFGVKHKEKIRALRIGVDVLTLTATPIPRTLNMSLLGIKDMELIEDPPEERYPIRTYVSEERPDVISESIRRELDRGGQAFVVFNRVSGIERVAEMLRELVPSARIAVCHAKMNERMIEEIMLDFYENEYDILLSTTIIESGLDISNVNTMIILDADRLGLTQLYQLRGRVGRTNRIAFAYLMYRRDKALTEAAEKRLRTIREFTEFGSGFKIAMKDLEIRGAGNLVGISQHGHMSAVGYELYCKLLDETVSKIRDGEPGTDVQESECRIDIFAPAAIPSEYISDEVVKLQAYKRISYVNNDEQARAVCEELTDRFGAVPASVRTLIYAAYYRHLGETSGLAEIKVERGNALFIYREAPEDLMRRIFTASESVRKSGGDLEADMKYTPKIRLSVPDGLSDEESFEVVLSALKALSVKT